MGAACSFGAKGTGAAGPEESLSFDGTGEPCHVELGKTFIPGGCGLFTGGYLNLNFLVTDNDFHLQLFEWVICE
jgi:hypothetical protein